MALAPLTLVLFTGCERPPLSFPPEDAGPPPEGEWAVDYYDFINDRYALGAKWYEYGSNGHILTPKDEVYVVADRDASPVAYYAFEVASYYDGTSADSGFFTISHMTHGGAAWSTPTSFALSGTVKYVPPICLDLRGPLEVPCSGRGWQIQFTAFRYLPPMSLHPLATNPGIFVRSTSGQPDRGGVRLAVVNAAEISEVDVDPATLAELVEEPPPTHGATEFAHDRYASNLPLNGMAIGRTWYDAQGKGTQHVFFLRTMDMHVVKLQLLVPTAGRPPTSVTLHHSVWDDEGDGVVRYSEGEAADQQLQLPAPYGLIYFDFSADPIVVDLGGDLLHDPAVTSDWDLAFEVTTEGTQVLVSPGAVVYNWTTDPEGGDGSIDFEAAVPPQLQ